MASSRLRKVNSWTYTFHSDTFVDSAVNAYPVQTDYTCIKRSGENKHFYRSQAHTFNVYDLTQPTRTQNSEQQHIDLTASNFWSSRLWKETVTIFGCTISPHYISRHFAYTFPEWNPGLLSLDFCHVNTNVGWTRPGFKKSKNIPSFNCSLSQQLHWKRKSHWVVWALTKLLYSNIIRFLMKSK